MKHLSVLTFPSAATAGATGGHEGLGPGAVPARPAVERAARRKHPAARALGRRARPSARATARGMASRRQAFGRVS